MSTNIIAQTVATPTILYSGQIGTTADATIATVPAGSTWSIKTASVTNVSGASANLTLAIVPSGQTSTAARRVIPGVLISQADVVSFTDLIGGMQLKAGDFIVAWSNQASAINLLITGVEAS